MQFDRGYLSPYFVTNAEKMICELDEPTFLLHEKKLSPCTSAWLFRAARGRCAVALATRASSRSSPHWKPYPCWSRRSSSLRDFLPNDDHKGGGQADDRIGSFVAGLGGIYIRGTHRRPTFTIDPHSGDVAGPFGRFVIDATRFLYPLLYPQTKERIPLEGNSGRSPALCSGGQDATTPRLTVRGFSTRFRA